MSDELRVREKPEAVTQINKPVVLTILFLLVAVIAVVTIQSLRTTTSTQSSAANALTDQPKNSDVVDSAVNALPASYQDADKIKSYFNSPNVEALSPEVKAELEKLKAEQQSLQGELAKLRESSSAVHEMSDEELKQAATSGLFFPGVSPPAKAPTTSQSAESKSSDAQSAADKNSASGEGYISQNMQQQKMDFLKPQKDSDQIYNQHGLVNLASPYEVQAGTIISAQLITAIDTSLPGDVVAQVQSDLYDSATGDYLLIPKGSKLIGKYDSQISYGQTRVLIVFYRIIRPDGSSIILHNSTGTDLFGQSGMHGSVNNHWGRVLGAATLSTLLSLGTGVASDHTSGGTAAIPSAGQNALLGAAGSIAETGQGLTQRAMNIQPTLRIPMGYEFNIIVNRDMVLKPFDEASS